MASVPEKRYNNTEMQMFISHRGTCVVKTTDHGYRSRVAGIAHRVIQTKRTIVGVLVLVDITDIDISTFHQTISQIENGRRIADAASEACLRLADDTTELLLLGDGTSRQTRLKTHLFLPLGFCKKKYVAKGHNI